jgi:hypothetical protein
MLDQQMVKQRPRSPEHATALTMKWLEETPEHEPPKSNGRSKNQGKLPANKIQHIGSLYRLLLIGALLNPKAVLIRVNKQLLSMLIRYVIRR